MEKMSLKVLFCTEVTEQFANFFLTKVSYARVTLRPRQPYDCCRWSLDNNRENLLTIVLES